MAYIHIRGKEKVLQNLNREIKKIEGLSAKGLLKAGLYVQAESMKEVPVMDGVLKNSSYCTMEQKSSGPVAYVGYHAIYAAKTHENRLSGKTGGKSPSGKKYKKWAKVGNWKFLENPLKRSVQMIINIIKANVKIS